MVGSKGNIHTADCCLVSRSNFIYSQISSLIMMSHFHLDWRLLNFGDKGLHPLHSLHLLLICQSMWNPCCRSRANTKVFVQNEMNGRKPIAKNTLQYLHCVTRASSLIRFFTATTHFLYEGSIHVSYRRLCILHAPPPPKKKTKLVGAWFNLVGTQ